MKLGKDARRQVAEEGSVKRSPTLLEAHRRPEIFPFSTRLDGSRLYTSVNGLLNFTETFNTAFFSPPVKEELLTLNTNRLFISVLEIEYGFQCGFCWPKAVGLI